jgi:4-hydroxy-2-oxoheptanedioate aldolase
MAHPVMIESLGRAGFDFVGLDMQHGSYGWEAAGRALQMLDLLGVPSYFRLSFEELPLVPRILDSGATGVIIATVGDVATAQRAISLTRYQPEGMRSYGGQRFGLRPEPHMPTDVRPEVWVMIETLDGVRNVGAIAATPGLAGLYIGPADLALAYGLKPGTGPASPQWRSAVDGIVAAAHDHGIEVGTFAPDGTAAKKLLDGAFDRVVVASDLAIMRLALARECAMARGQDPSTVVVDVEI